MDEQCFDLLRRSPVGDPSLPDDVQGIFLLFGTLLLLIIIIIIVGIFFISIVIILLIIFLRILSLEFHGAAGRYGRNIMEGGGRGLGDVQLTFLMKNGNKVQCQLEDYIVSYIIIMFISHRVQDGYTKERSMTINH